MTDEAERKGVGRVRPRQRTIKDCFVSLEQVAKTQIKASLWEGGGTRKRDGRRMRNCTLFHGLSIGYAAH